MSASLPPVSSEELTRPREPETIIVDEYRVLRELASFECPRKRDPRICDGRSCPTKPDNIHDDYYDECVDARWARLRLSDIAKGKIIVHVDRGDGFEVPLP